MQYNGKEYHEGFPPERGWYNCYVEGEGEVRLKSYMCVLSRKHEWVREDGQYEYGIVWWADGLL